MVKLKRAAAVLLAVAFLTMFSVTALADQQPDTLFVSDRAEVLSVTDKSKIQETCSTVFEQTGSRFLIVTADFLGGKTIEQYASDLYEQNQMADNGLLLVVSTAEENYHVMQGTALAELLSDRQLDSMLKQVFEEDFAAGEYRSAIMAFHQEAVKALEEIYSVTSDPVLYRQLLEEQRILEQKQARERKIWFGLFSASFFVAVLFFIRMIISSFYRRKRRR